MAVGVAVGVAVQDQVVLPTSQQDGDGAKNLRIAADEEFRTYIAAIKLHLLGGAV